MPMKALVFSTFKLPLHLAINEGGSFFVAEQQRVRHGETHCSMTWVVPDGLSLAVQQRAARHAITLLMRVPRDTGLENYGIKKRGLVKSIVFQVDLMWKENSIKQLCCTQALSRRVHSWSFLWFNKNVFAFIYYNSTRKLKHLARHQLKNKSLTNVKNKISISHLNNIKPILFKNIHRAFVWAVSHPRFLQQKNEQKSFWDEMLLWKVCMVLPCTHETQSSLQTHLLWWHTQK